MKYFICTASMNENIFKENEVYKVLTQDNKQYVYDEQGNKRASPEDFNYIGFDFRVGYYNSGSLASKLLF